MYAITLEEQQNALRNNAQQMHMREAALYQYRKKGRTITEEDTRDYNYRRMTQDFLQTAQPMFWSKQTADLVRDASNSLALEGLSCSKDLLALQSAFCWFDMPWGSTTLQVGDKADEDSETLSGAIHAISWYWIPENVTHVKRRVYPVDEEGNRVFRPWLLIDAFTKQDGQLVTSEYYQCNEGVITYEGDPTLLRFVLAANAFIRQRLLVQRSHPVERAVRRRLERQHVNSPSTISVVHLRAAEYANFRPKQQDSTVEFACRWFVRGHWRNQWYPRTQCNRPKFIAPYLKGPEGKPIKTPSQVVYAVTR